MGAVSSLVAFTIGFTALAAGGTYAGIASHQAGRKKEAKQRQKEEKILGAQTAAAAEALAAPGKAAEKARLASIERRKRRARTLLTSETGVLETPSAKKTLLGE